MGMLRAGRAEVRGQGPVTKSMGAGEQDSESTSVKGKLSVELSAWKQLKDRSETP